MTKAKLWRVKFGSYLSIVVVNAKDVVSAIKEALLKKRDDDACKLGEITEIDLIAKED